MIFHAKIILTDIIFLPQNFVKTFLQHPICVHLHVCMNTECLYVAFLVLQRKASILIKNLNFLEINGKVNVLEINGKVNFYYPILNVKSDFFSQTAELFKSKKMFSLIRIILIISNKH